MQKTVVLNVVGLTPSLIGEWTPAVRTLIERGKLSTIREVTPAVTCSAQATYLTGKRPSDHGIVGNGWYFRDTCEIRFWQQSNKLVQSPLVWETARARDPSFTVANINWWFAMYSSADYTVTPRPQYPADGRKHPDCWTHPASLRDELQAKLGTFPLFKYWGPATSIDATMWLARAAIEIDRQLDPTLSLIYLPHLDYNLQRAPESKGVIEPDLFHLEGAVGSLIRHFEQRNARVIVLSEYGITPVVRPVHINRVLRAMNLLSIRVERGRELLDAGASRAFAVADHQIAHVYVNDAADVPPVAARLTQTPGIAHVVVGDQRASIGLAHERAGDIIALAEPDAWFTYYFWLDDARAPDYARTVDIHRKPGYDPAELFFDPKLRAPKLKAAATIAKRKLGFRATMDVIGLDASIVRGSHGVPAATREHRPVFIGDPSITVPDEIDATDVHDLILRHIFD